MLLIDQIAITVKIIRKYDSFTATLYTSLPSETTAMAIATMQEQRELQVLALLGLCEELGNGGSGCESDAMAPRIDIS